MASESHYEPRQWISVDDRLPNLNESRNIAKVIVCTERGDVRQMYFAANLYAKSERGQRPRWEESQGCLAWSEPKFWMPMPEPHPSTVKANKVAQKEVAG